MPYKHSVTTKLPQQTTASEASARAAQLERSRALYQYESPPAIPGISFVKGPFANIPGEAPSRSYRLKIGISTARLLLNNICSCNSMHFPQALYVALSTMYEAVSVDPENFSQLQAALNRVRQRLHTVADRISSKTDEQVAHRTMELMQYTRTHGSSFEEMHQILQPYRQMYFMYSLPPVADVFMEDAVFARLRTAGFNPMSLFRVKDSEHLPFWVDHDFLPCKDVVKSTADAVEQGLIYAIDYSFIGAFNSIPQPPSQGTTAQSRAELKRFIPSKALFAQAGRGKTLEAVAIQIGDETVYPHARDTRWEVAKMAVNTCDAVHHELIAHLGRTHLMIEPFIAATHRQLPRSHPIHTLLIPHFEGTVFINDTAARDLVAPGGDIERIFAGNITNIMTWTAKQVLSTKFNQLFPEVDLASRGLLNSSTTLQGQQRQEEEERNVLPFAYRDDALAHFDALYRWVYAYVTYYYPGGDSDVKNDTELQAWVDELTDDDKGKVQGFGDNGDGKIETLYYLARCLTLIIFSASVQHAAVNFPQKTLMAYAPAVAGAQYAHMSTTATGDDERAHIEQWCQTLTPPRVAIDQLDILNLLGSVYHTQLGHYENDQFCDKAHRRWPKPVRDAHAQYLEELGRIDRRIVEREQDETLKYHYLRPRNVPQSINI